MQQLCVSESISEPKTSGTAGAGGLRVDVLNASQLTAAQVSCWRELQQSNPDLLSPCFAPEFVRAVACVRNDVQVGVLKQGDELVGFFPFQRRSGNRAGPAGGLVSDYQGIICRPDFICDPQELLRGCRLVTWDFDRLLSSQTCFVPYHRICEPSARIDLSEGYSAYVAQRRKTGTRQIQRCEYMLRRLERDLGGLRFVHHSTEVKRLDQVLTWKSQQYRRSGWKDLFASSWGRGFVERIHAYQSPAFAGMLSLLYAGDHLVAGHMGMRSRTIWHYWFPAYDRRYSKYSPGLILLLKMAQAAGELGLEYIDMGTGMSLYKRRLMNASISVAEGSVERPSCIRAVRSIRRKLGLWVKWLGTNNLAARCTP